MMKKFTSIVEDNDLVIVNKFQIDNFKSKNFNNVIKNRKTSKLI